MNQSQYRVKTCRWHSAENAMTCFTFSCLTCGRSQNWGRKFALSAKKLNYKMWNKCWLSWVCFARIWSQIYFVLVKVTKGKRRSRGVAPLPLQIAVHRPLRLLRTALLIPLLQLLLQSWVRTDQRLPVSISPLFSGYVDEIVWSDHIDETYLAKPSSGTISFTVFYKLAFWMLFHLFPISFMFPVLKRFLNCLGFCSKIKEAVSKCK